MKVRVIDERCVGQGMCKMACPEVFDLSDEDGHSFVIVDEVPPEHEAAVEQAIRGCPEQAIVVVD